MLDSVAHEQVICYTVGDTLRFLNPNSSNFRVLTMIPLEAWNYAPLGD